MFQERGINNVDMDRLRSRVDAVQERRKVRHNDDIARVRQLGSAVHKARQAAEAAQRCWRIEPTDATMRDSIAAVQARGDAELALLDQCLGDRQLYNSILSETRP